VMPLALGVPLVRTPLAATVYCPHTCVTQTAPRLCVNGFDTRQLRALSTRHTQNQTVLLCYCTSKLSSYSVLLCCLGILALPLSCSPRNTMQCVSERLTSGQRACSSSSGAARLCPVAASRGCCLRACRATTKRQQLLRTPTSRQQLVTCAAYAAATPSLPANPAAATMAASSSPASQQGPRTSLDPMAAAWEEAWAPGRLLTVKSPEQFAQLQAEHPEKLIVLMCKSHACRPCKMFTRKYLSIVSSVAKDGSCWAAEGGEACCAHRGCTTVAGGCSVSRTHACAAVGAAAGGASGTGALTCACPCTTNS
jgi:hypothetical protein